MNTYNVTLMEKVKESLVEISPLDVAGPLVFKMMLEIVMDVDNSAL